MTRATTAYEDNFGYFDFDADPNEEDFYIFCKATSRPRRCARCRQPVRLQPDRELCARCVEAIEFGGDREQPTTHHKRKL